MAAQNTDELVISREGVIYKVTAGEVAALATGGGTSSAASYALNDFQDGEPLYVGKVKPDGTWLVQRYYTAANAFRHANRSNNITYSTYAAAWAARVGLTYAPFQELTGV